MTSFPPKFKFYLDENFPVPAGKFLRSRGHKVIEGIKVLKRTGLSDQRHLKESIKQDAILLAFDRDFMVNPGLYQMIAKSHGLILIEATDTKAATAQRILKRVLKVLTRNAIRGKICCASRDKIIFIKPS